MKLPRAWICSRCGNVDDLDPLIITDPDTGERVAVSQRCPCPHDEVTAQARQHDVEMRHRLATSRVRERERWQAWLAERRAS